MAKKSRWEKAQEYEESFWASIAEEVSRDSLQRIGFYEWRADQFRKRLASIGRSDLLNGNLRIMEIGSGPVGIIGYLPGLDRIAVDPLNRFYSSDPNLTLLRSDEVQYLDAPGESIPVQDGCYDLVIMENCIDHTEEPRAVLREIYRVLAPKGTLYITVNARSRLGFWVHRALARLELDPGHPHTFTDGRFRYFLQDGGFSILNYETGSWIKSWPRDVLSNNWKARAKALLWVSEYLLTAVAEKR